MGGLGGSRVFQGFLPSPPVDLATLHSSKLFCVVSSPFCPTSLLTKVPGSIALSPTSNSGPMAAAAAGCGGGLGICSGQACAALTHLHSLAIGNRDNLLPWAFLPVFGTVSGCWLIISSPRIFHSKLHTIFHKTTYHFKSL